jgi:hypothetical protein
MGTRNPSLVAEFELMTIEMEKVVWGKRENQCDDHEEEWEKRVVVKSGQSGWSG